MRISFLLFLISVPLYFFGQYTSTVTFNVDMYNDYLFLPEFDTLYVTGSFNDWETPGSGPDLMLTDPDKDWIYSVQTELDLGSYQYKYFFGYGWEC